MIIVGIDPGRKGALAGLNEAGKVVRVWEMPYIARSVDVVGICAFLDEVYYAMDEIHPKMEVWIEKVHAMPGQGVTSMFSFGESFGIIEGVIQTMELPMHLVAPQTWKAEILRDTDKTKEAAIEYIGRVHPEVDLLNGRRKPHDGIAEAICIAEYGYRRINGTSIRG